MEPEFAQQGYNHTGPLFYDVPAFSDNKTGPVFHGFFGRGGGVSKGVYNALNCGPGSDDNPANVKKNLDIVAHEIGLPRSNILTMYQTHGTVCLAVEEPWPISNRPQVDALITRKPGLALGVLTADCAPVLFWGQSKQGPVAAAAHVGWRGALAGILDETVKAMRSYGVAVEKIRACIGPCIGPRSYEVGAGFVKKFEHENPDNERFFKAANRTGHYLFDLAGYCAARLSKLGLRYVAIKDLDTFFNEEDFFSYRRATHRGEQDYGRQISLIYIRQ